MYKLCFKRIFDIVSSTVLLVAISPILLYLFYLIKKNLGSPVIFTQVRPGKGCRLFKMYKFRTMTDERDASGKLLLDSMRLTKFGKKLRAMSLDELPELINIIKGDMSVVGPRPQLVKDMVFFDEQQTKRQDVLPGLTGLAQISGRNNIAWEDKFKYDLLYIKNISFWEDLRIIYRTVFKVSKMEDIATDGMETAEDLGDYLLRSDRIDEKTYEAGVNLASKLLEEKGL